jgi:hypothetical protein
MSKNYFMVQVVWAPGVLPTNTYLHSAILEKMDQFIKSGKSPMCGSWSSHADLETIGIPVDYRMPGSGSSTMLSRETFSLDAPLAGLRIFLDQSSAEEFMEFVLFHGALVARIITEDQVGVVDGVPNTVTFPEESRVAQCIWPGRPNFVYSGTYPEPGPADATPVYRY